MPEPLQQFEIEARVFSITNCHPFFKLTFDLKKEAWKTGESPEMELRWSWWDGLGLRT